MSKNSQLMPPTSDPSPTYLRVLSDRKNFVPLRTLQSVTTEATDFASELCFFLNPVRDGFRAFLIFIQYV